MQPDKSTRRYIRRVVNATMRDFVRQIINEPSAFKDLIAEAEVAKQNREASKAILP